MRQNVEWCSSPSKDQNRAVDGHFSCSELRFCYFREIVSTFSLRSRAIGSSEFFGARRKVVLRDKGNAWAPILRSFDKRCEVGVLSYLSYTLFKCFVDD